MNGDRNGRKLADRDAVIVSRSFCRALMRLLENGPITLSVWNSVTGVMMRRADMQGSNMYHVEFDLRPLAFGTYVVRLDTLGERILTIYSSLNRIPGTGEG